MALCLQTKRLIFVQLALTFLFYNSKLNNNKNNGTGIDENYNKNQFLSWRQNREKKAAKSLKSRFGSGKEYFF